MLSLMTLKKTLYFYIFRLTLLLGVIGNMLILVAILGYKKMKSPTNVFLASLALADLLLCLICIPVKLAELFSFSWTFGWFLCKFVNYMQNVSAVASVLNLTVMSIERYIISITYFSTLA